MIVGVAILAIGVILVLAGSMKSAQHVRGVFGDVNHVTAKLSEGTGVVPRWLSLVVLIGYAAIVTGAILLLVRVVA